MQTIETYVSITQAKAKLLDLVRQLSETNDTIAITKNGIPEAVMLSMSKFEGFLETIDILADPEMMNQLKSSAQDVKAVRLLDLDEVF
jgi:antitoxin YefM